MFPCWRQCYKSNRNCIRNVSLKMLFKNVGPILHSTFTNKQIIMKTLITSRTKFSIPLNTISKVNILFLKIINNAIITYFAWMDQHFVISRIVGKNMTLNWIAEFMTMYSQWNLSHSAPSALHNHKRPQTFHKRSCSFCEKPNQSYVD